jgi:hypothetical protein
MKKMLEEIFLIFLLVFLWLTLPGEHEGHVSENLFSFQIEAILELRIEVSGKVFSWKRPREGWLEAEGENKKVFSFLWELSRLPKKLPESEAFPLVQKVILKTAEEELELGFARLRLGNRLPLFWQGRWWSVSGDVQQMLVELLRETE